MFMHQCGTPLRVGLYEIGEEKKGSDDDYLPIYKFDFAPNKIEVLRGIAERISFKYDLNWDANTLGVKLIDFMK